MLVVTEAVSIASEKVTEMFSLIETPVWPSVGDMEETVGAVVSVVVDAPSSLLLQEMTVRLKRNMEKIMSICLTWFPINGLGEPKLYHQSVCFTRMWEFTWI